MNITLTLKEEDYRRLMTLTYLGEWVVNATRKEPDAAYEAVMDKVYAGTAGSPLESLASYDDQGLIWNPVEEFEEEAHTMIDEYDDKTFWEELTGRLTERDLLEAHGERKLKGMREDERTRAASAIAKAYTKEFEEYGLDRLGFSED